jgi:hypothetical protein
MSTDSQQPSSANESRPPILKMSSESQQSSAYEPELVDQTRQQIRGLVHEIETLARSEASPEEFYQGFLHRVVAALAAIGGAVWTLDEEGRLTLSSQINLGETRLHESQDDQQRHGRLLRKVITSRQATVVQPRFASAEEDVANPTDFLLVLGVLKSDQEVRGVVEVFQRSGGRPAVERGYLRFVLQMCEVAEDYLKTRQLRLYSDRQAIWTQLEQFTHLAHGSLDPRATAYTLANEGRRLIDCDRISVAIRKGRHLKIEAVSGQETFDKRSNTVTLLGELATVVVRAGEPLWYTGDTRDLPPQVEEAVEAYVDESHSKCVVVLPLAKPSDHEETDQQPKPKLEFVGALIIEQINTDGIPASMRRRIDVVGEHGSTALTNAMEHNSLFLMPVWRTIGKSKWIVSARTLPKTIAVAIVLLAALFSLFLIPAEFQLHGKGTLEPIKKASVFAGLDGNIMGLFVKSGDLVKAGDPLVQLQSTELGVQFEELRSKISSNNEQIRRLESDIGNPKLAPYEKDKNDRDLLSARALQEGYMLEMQLLEDKRKNLIVRSPIDGKVITFKVEELLGNRPVQRGDQLLEVIDPTGDWELEVRMPEDRMGHIKKAQHEIKPDLNVDYIMAGDPGHTLRGTVREIQEKAEVQGEEGNTVLVRVKINKDELGIEPQRGAGASAKVDCGKRSLGYVWFHDVIEFVQSKILFKW